MDNVVDMILNNGMAVVVVAYFIFRDYKFMNQLVSLMGHIESVLNRFEAITTGKGGDSDE